MRAALDVVRRTLRPREKRIEEKRKRQNLIGREEYTNNTHGHRHTERETERALKYYKRRRRRRREKGREGGSQQGALFCVTHTHHM